MLKVTKPRLLLIALSVLLLALTGGCGKPKRVTAEKPKETKPTELPGTITGAGWRIRWRTREADSTGKSQPLLTADARHGTLSDDSGKESVTAYLDEVRARLYRDGKPTADVKAPHIMANRSTGMVIGTGGVTVRSLANPPDTVITADKITWNTSDSKVVAVGNAHLTRKPRNGPPMSQIGGRIIFDTTLNEFEVQ